MLGLFPQGTSSAQPMLCNIQTNSCGDRKGMVRSHSVSLHEAAGGRGGQNKMYGGCLVYFDNGQAPPHLCSAIFGRIAAEIEGARSDPNPSASARLQGAGRPGQVVWRTLGPSLRWTSPAPSMLCDIRTNSRGDREGAVRSHSVGLNEVAGGGESKHGSGCQPQPATKKEQESGYGQPPP